MEASQPSIVLSDEHRDEGAAVLVRAGGGRERADLSVRVETDGGDGLADVLAEEAEFIAHARAQCTAALYSR